MGIQLILILGMATNYYKYWGKTLKDGRYHLLPYHLLDVSAVGWVAIDRFPHWTSFFNCQLGLDMDQTRRLGCWLLALHDIGKFSTSFQKQSETYQILGLNDSDSFVSNLNHVELGWLAWNELILTDADAGDGCMILKAVGIADSAVDILNVIVGAFIGHHGKPPKNINRGSINYHFSQRNKADLLEYVRMVTDYFKPFDLPVFESTYDWKSNETRLKSVSFWLAGFAVLCDWIGSNSDWFIPQSTIIDLDTYWKKYALPSANIALQRVALDIKTGPTKIPFLELFSALMKNSEPTPLQLLIDQLEIQTTPQLVIIEDVMGAGKTEAALTLAQHWMAHGKATGVYFGLPTMATTDAMFKRIQEFYPFLFDPTVNASLVLAHSARDMNPDFLAELEASKELMHADSNECPAGSQSSSAWLVDHRKKALLADVGVGTIDQVLMSVISSNHQSLRLLGLYKKVLILDEVHASDAYMHGITRRLLEFHSAAGGFAILLSATLPEQTKAELIHSFQKGLSFPETGVLSDIFGLSRNYPLVTSVTGDGVDEIPVEPAQSSRRTISVRLFQEEAQVKSYIVQKSKVGCVVWIRNTVNDAIQDYLDLSHLAPDAEIDLFHARYTLGDRLGNQSRLINQFGPAGDPSTRRGKIIIATQVVEQSLDVDFDYMVTDLAPVDLVIQRMGRLRRHKRNQNGVRSDHESRGPAELIILSPDPSKTIGKKWIQDPLPGTAAVYFNHGHLWLTANWFFNNPTFQIPEQLRDAVEDVYQPDAYDRVPEELQESYNKASGKEYSYEHQAYQASLKLENGYCSQETLWEDDIVATTRLGEPIVKVRLAKWHGEQLVPWIQDADSKMAWRLSDVQVRQTKLAQEIVSDRRLVEAVQRLKQAWPKQGKYETVIVVNPVSDGVWEGRGVNKAGKVVNLEYSVRFGLRFL